MVEIAHAIEAATTLDVEQAKSRRVADDVGSDREGTETIDGTADGTDVTKSPSVHVAENEKQEAEHDELPNGGYGWVIMFCLLGLNACTWGECRGSSARR